MKKVWLAAAMLGLVTMASSVFADVQNIRLSGDIRIRGYYLKNANSIDDDPGPASNRNKKDSSFIIQRTRITCEADLEDHVLVVITLQAQGQWGQVPPGASPAGTPAGAYPGNRAWGVGITEAYVQFSEMFFTPATLKLGRQYLNYGKGLVISSYDQVYNFDAGRLVLDFYPFTIDVVGAKLSDGSALVAPTTTSGHGGSDLLFLNTRYEMKDSIIKNVEAYFGWIPRGSATTGAPIVPFPPTAGVGQAGSPWILGLRTDLTPVKGLQVWLEGAYEGGQKGPNIAGDAQSSTLQAFLGQVGLKYTLKDVKMEPSFNATYTYASGGGNASGIPGATGNNGNAFVPWFDSVEGANGYLFQPLLSNIQIFNVGASIKPAKNVTASLQGYYYLKNDGDTFARSNPWIDYGGLNGLTAAQGWAHELGAEIDAIIGYDYSKDARFQLVYAAFVPSRAFAAPTTLGATVGSISSVVHGLRGEVNVKF
jgi:hypothetical protein